MTGESPQHADPPCERRRSFPTGSPVFPPGIPETLWDIPGTLSVALAGNGFVKPLSIGLTRMSDNLEATFRIFVQYCASMLLDEKFTRGAARKDDDREYFLPAIAKVRAHVERCRRSLQENMGQDTIRKHGDTWEIVSKLPSLEINSRFEENCSQEISEFVDDGDQECERCCGRKKVAMYDVALKGEAYDQLALIYPHQAPKREVCPDYISWSTCASCTKWIALYHNSCHFDLHILCAISRKIRPGLDKGDEIRAILHAVMYDEDWIAHHFGNFSKVNRSVQDTLDQVRVGSILKSTQDTRDPKPEEVKWVLEMAFCARDYIASEDQTQKAKENKSKPPNILPNKQFENRPKRRKISCIDLFSDSDAEDKQEVH
eukprot:1315911-Amorphochlora_amoeboformis.AAC.3